MSKTAVMDESYTRADDFDENSAQQMAAAIREIFKINLAGSCRMLGIDVFGTPELIHDPIPPITLSGDILLVRVGPRRLVHIMHVFDREPDLEATMFLYRTAIQRAYPDHELRHYAVVLSEELL